MNKVLIICGPTATGKTKLGLELAEKLNAEIISADSRQVYRGMDIVTGKDLPAGRQVCPSTLIWHLQPLNYYEIDGIPVWLYDLVNPDEQFNVSFWKEAADMVINDISLRNKLPIIVGGTGLYIKSLTADLKNISIPSDPGLRSRLQKLSVAGLFNYLNSINSRRAALLNNSDRHNPRRLERAIEIELFKTPSPQLWRGVGGEVAARPDILILGLTAPLPFLLSKIDTRIGDRIQNGAADETKQLLTRYSPNLPSFSSPGYQAYSGPDYRQKWQTLEHQYARRQLTWFKKQPGIIWFDISRSGWQTACLAAVFNWYNSIKHEG